MGLSRKHLKKNKAAKSGKEIKGPKSKADLVYLKACEFLDKQQMTEAIFFLKKVLELDPRHVPALADLGHIYFKTRDYEQAEALYERALQVEPQNFKVLKYKGHLYYDRGQYDLAEAVLSKCYESDPTDVAVIILLAKLYNTFAKPEQAVDILKPLIYRNGLHSDAYYHWLQALMALSKQDEAIEFAEKLLDRHVSKKDAIKMLGDVYLKSGLYEKAEAFCLDVLKDYPNDMAAQNIYALALRNLGRYEEAVEQLQESHEQYPYEVEILINLAYLYVILNDADKIREVCEKALTLRPTKASAHYNYSIGLFYAEEYRDAWMHHEWRWAEVMRDSNLGRKGVPNWHGQDLSGKHIVVYEDQGVGDSMQFCRYVMALKKRYPDCKITFICLLKLVPLFQKTLEGFATVKPRDVDLTILKTEHVDYLVSVMSLPIELDLGLTVEGVDIPYLRTSREIEYHTQDKDFVIGLAWHTKSDVMAKERSLAIDEFKFLSKYPNVRFINLQYGDTEEEIKRAREFGLEIENDETVDQWNDLQSFVDQVAACDLVISIDNTTVHVAGALDVPTWVLLSRRSYYRWLLDYNNTPWYPSLTLFRQGRDESYTPLLAEVEARLDAYFTDRSDKLLRPEPFVSSKEKVSKQTVVILGGEGVYAPFVTQFNSFSLSKIYSDAGYDPRVVTYDEVAGVDITVPEYKDFQSDKVLSDWYMNNPTLMYRLRYADEVVFNPENLSGLPADTAAKFIYLAYVCVTTLNKRLVVAPHNAVFNANEFPYVEALNVVYQKAVQVSVLTEKMVGQVKAAGCDASVAVVNYEVDGAVSADNNSVAFALGHIDAADIGRHLYGKSESFKGKVSKFMLGRGAFPYEKNVGFSMLAKSLEEEGFDAEAPVIADVEQYCKEILLPAGYIVADDPYLCAWALGHGKRVIPVTNADMADVMASFCMTAKIRMPLDISQENFCEALLSAIEYPAHTDINVFSDFKISQ